MRRATWPRLMRACSPGRAWRVALAVGLALAQVACGAPAGPDAVRPYRYALPTDQVVRWPAGSAIRVWVESGRGFRAGRLSRAFTRAAREWNRAVGAEEFRLVRAGRAAAADVVLAWSDGAWPVDDAGCPARADASAVTAFCASRGEPGRLATFPAAAGSDRSAAETSMLVVVASGLATDAARLRRVVAHELGHVLGIAAHSPSPADLMWGGTLRTAVPSAADRATVRALYRARADLQP